MWRSTGAGHGSQLRPWGAPISASPLEKHNSSSLSWEIKRNSSLWMAEARRACPAQHCHLGMIFFLRLHRDDERTKLPPRLGAVGAAQSIWESAGSVPELNPCPWCWRAAHGDIPSALESSWGQQFLRSELL